MLNKISNKIIYTFTLLILLQGCILLIFFTNLIRDTHIKIITREMKEKARFIEHNYQREQNFVSRNDFPNFIDDMSKIINLRITIIDNKGVVIADSEVEDVDSMDNHKYRIEIKNSIINGIGDSIRYSNTLKTDMLYFAKRSKNFILRLAKPLYEIDEVVNKLRNFILLFGLLIIVMSIVAIIYISRKITSPINEVIDFAEQFSTGDYSKRILNYNDDEIGTLQRSLNRLADIIVFEMENLILEQKKLQITIESINDGIAVIDNKKRILIANKAFGTLLDIRCSFLNRIYFEVIRSSFLNSKIEYSLSNGEPNYFEDELINGKICEFFINPIKEEKTIQGILIVVHNITDKKRIDRLKTDLVGNLSHELKTPLAIVKGYLETISDNFNNPDLCKNFIEKAIINVNRQNLIITDMLKLNMLETMRNFQMEEINLKNIIENCTDILDPKAASKNIKISKTIDVIDMVIKGNRFLAEEIFFNIIDNAINYNIKNGEICILAEKSFRKISIFISDTGIGIPNEAFERIFERFYRVDKSRSRLTGGTGLGLSIVKHAIELLNWDIKFSSNNNGTTFIIEI